MFLSVKELEVRKLLFDVDFPPGEIDFEIGRVRQLSPLHSGGSAELLDNTLGEIRVTGKLDVELEAECDRCLESVRFPVRNDFDLFYRPAIEDAAGEIEIDPGETEIGFYKGDGIELAEVLREHVLLSLPMQQICRPDCLGICPQCGRNRNTGSCDCDPRLLDNRWEALRGFKAGQKR